MNLDYKKLFLNLIILLYSITLLGQNTTKLNQKVSIDVDSIPISEMLQHIEKQSNVKFAYNPNLINSSKKVSVPIENKAIKEVLKIVLGPGFEYKLRENYVIITQKQDNKSSKTTLSGYIIDKSTNFGLENVSIYTSSGANVISSATGGFTLTFSKEEASQLNLRKKGYQSRNFETYHTSSEQIKIELTPSRLIVKPSRDSISATHLTIPQSAVSTMYRINPSLLTNQENITDLIEKPVSFSLYPGIATYGNLSGSIKYRLAINFVGYNRSINGAEFSMLSSINKDNVSGFQVAGLSNHVGQNVDGFQVAGILNNLGGNLEGLQISGIYSTILGHVKGGQISGIRNDAKQVFGAQVAGLMNACDTISGVQIAGISNQSDQFSGIQLAGIYNHSRKANGSQISGLVNVGHNVKGFQLGVINVADTLSGIPIGFFNFIKNGYKRLGMYSDELFPVNIEFRSGVKRFYSILRVGAQTELIDSDNSLFTYGFGFGSSFGLSDRLSLDFDVTGNPISRRKHTNPLSLNIANSLGFELLLTDHIAITGGATYNTYLLNESLLSDPIFNVRDAYIMDTSDQFNKTTWRSWLGYRLGVRWVL